MIIEYISYHHSSPYHHLFSAGHRKQKDWTQPLAKTQRAQPSRPTPDHTLCGPWPILVHVSTWFIIRVYKIGPLLPCARSNMGPFLGDIVYIYMYVCICIYIYMCIYIYICMSIYMYIYIPQVIDRKVGHLEIWSKYHCKTFWKHLSASLNWGCFLKRPQFGIPNSLTQLLRGKIPRADESTESTEFLPKLANLGHFQMNENSCWKKPGLHLRTGILPTICGQICRATPCGSKLGPVPCALGRTWALSGCHGEKTNLPQNAAFATGNGDDLSNKRCVLGDQPQCKVWGRQAAKISDFSLKRPWNPEIIADRTCSEQQKMLALSVYRNHWMSIRHHQFSLLMPWVPRCFWREMQREPRHVPSKKNMRSIYLLHLFPCESNHESVWNVIIHCPETRPRPSSCLQPPTSFWDHRMGVFKCHEAKG